MRCKQKTISMDIIKHGKNYHEITCPYCGCVFSYLDGMLKTDVITRRADNSRYVRCPECVEDIDIE